MVDIKLKGGWLKPPLCVWCSKPWTDSMMEIESYTSSGCETCDYGSETTVTVTIHCDHCHRLVYQKDGVSDY